MTLRELFRDRIADMEGMAARLRETARGLGLPYGDREKTYNSRLAQELGKWAEGRGLGEAFHRAVFHAYFAQCENIAKVPALLALAEKTGLPAADARRVLEERTFRDAVDRDWKYSLGAGVTAVPTFRLSGRSLVGAQPYVALVQLVEAGGVDRRSRKPSPQSLMTLRDTRNYEK